MHYRKIDAAKGYLDERGIDFALFHEAALAAWDLSFNVFLEAVDVVTDAAIKADPDTGYESVELPNGTFIRIWPASDILEGDWQDRAVYSEKYGCAALDPHLVLELLPASPEARFLLEARARLALALYADDMDDEQLMTFARYIRF